PVKARAPAPAPAPAPAVEATAVLPPMPSPEVSFEPVLEEASDTEIFDDFANTEPPELADLPEVTESSHEAAFMLDLPSDTPAPVDTARAPAALMEERPVLPPLERLPDLAAPDL